MLLLGTVSKILKKFQKIKRKTKDKENIYKDGGVALLDLDSGVRDLDLLRLLGDGDLLDLLYGSGDLESDGDFDLDLNFFFNINNCLTCMKNEDIKQYLKLQICF